MVLSKTVKGIVGILGLIAPSIINIVSPSPTIAFALEIERVKGNCPPLNCQLLLKDLKGNWDWKIEEWLNSSACEDRKTLGLNVWRKEENQKVVSVVCWGEADEDQKVYGTHVGILPMPGYESSFGSKWDCQNNDECENFVELLESLYPYPVKEAQVRCGINNGQIGVLNDNGNIHIQCEYIEPNIQIDTDFDGVSDEEMVETPTIQTIIYRLN